MTSRIGRIETLALKKVWPKEDADFTPWLEQNIGELDHVLGIGLRAARREQRAGLFRVDIVADTYEDSVAIENQYGRSDHQHLGQLLTYIAHPDQEISQGIWIVEHARDEHIKAVERLNEAEIVRIWMVEVKAIRIADDSVDTERGASLPAPEFQVVAAPSDAPTTGGAAPGLKAFQIATRAFQTALFDQARKERIDSPFWRLSPSVNTMRDSSARNPGLLYRMAAKPGEARVVVTNMKPRNWPGTWLRAYDELEAEREQIDREFAEEGPSGVLNWWDDRSANGRWGVTYKVDIDLEAPDEASLRELNQAAAAMKTVFGPRIGQLPAELEDAPLEPSGNGA